MQRCYLIKKNRNNIIIGSTTYSGRDNIIISVVSSQSSHFLRSTLNNIIILSNNMKTVGRNSSRSGGSSSRASSSSSSSSPSSAIIIVRTILLHLLLLPAATVFFVVVVPGVRAQTPTDPDAANHKYRFFCGSSFADVQADTCGGRQWCPSSSDDECTVPGHACFANTPCDARLIEDVSVPTYSLSARPGYDDPTDRMFCGVDYADAVAACEAGGEEGAGRHCPDMECAISGQVCFIDMPSCSYLAMTNPDADPLAGVSAVPVSETEAELPDPGSELSTTFCGPTFQEAASACSSGTWCRHGNSQECPNGETCFVGVNADNPECEINAIMKKEWEEGGAAQQSDGGGGASDAPSSMVGIPTTTAAATALSPTDPRNQNFCGLDWEDASSNCDLGRFCPNGDGDCVEEGHACQTYTTCQAADMTFTPT